VLLNLDFDSAYWQ